MEPTDNGDTYAPAAFLLVAGVFLRNTDLVFCPNASVLPTVKEYLETRDLTSTKAASKLEVSLFEIWALRKSFKRIQSDCWRNSSFFSSLFKKSSIVACVPLGIFSSSSITYNETVGAPVITPSRIIRARYRGLFPSSPMKVWSCAGRRPTFINR